MESVFSQLNETFIILYLFNNFFSLWKRRGDIEKILPPFSALYHLQKSWKFVIHWRSSDFHHYMLYRKFCRDERPFLGNEVSWETSSKRTTQSCLLIFRIYIFKFKKNEAASWRIQKFFWIQIQLSYQWFLTCYSKITVGPLSQTYSTIWKST